MSHRHGSQRPITEQIEELKAKIALLDGDRKAYYESSQYATKSNAEKIQHLRRENSELRTQLRDRLSADDHVINQAFQNRPVERAALSNKTGPDAVQTLDYLVCDTKKKLNAMQHVTTTKKKRLQELETQYDLLVKDASEADASDAGESEDAMRLRDIENRLDKATLKLNEAEHIHKTYEQIKAKFQEEGLAYNNTLSAMEADIRQCRVDLEELRMMNADAQISRDAAQQELQKHETVVYKDRKNREVELTRMKKEAEEKKMSHERVEKRLAQRGSISGDDGLGQDRGAVAGGSGGEENQQKISSYEEAFKRIKEATGVSDLREVVLRFENQGDTREHLEELKRESEKQIQRLREERERLLNEYEEMKYSGEAKLSSGQRIVEQYQKQLSDENERRESAQRDLKRSSDVLIQCKAGVEHLSEKLAHIKATKGHAPQAQISQQADEYVLDLLGKCEEKLVNLLGELDGQDVDTILEKLQQDEFGVTVESKLPTYNTRVKLPQTQRDVYDDEDESGDDEGDVLTRGALKKQSQQIIDQKTKKRMPRKKKKGK